MVPDRPASSGPAWARAGRGLGALAALVAAAATLGVGAVHGARLVPAEASDAQAAAWRLDAAYYRCLAVQARSLVAPGETVSVSRADLGAWGTLAKVVAPFAVMTDRPGHVVLSLRHQPGAGSCLGTVVVARTPGGRVEVGRGAAVAGPGPPPTTPL